MHLNWIHIFWKHNVTWTEWLWEREIKLSVNIPNTFIWIKHSSEIKNKFKRKDNVIIKKYTQLNKLFINLSNFLKEKYQNEVDPVKYLYHLYYVEKLSTIDIFDRLAYMWGYQNKEKDNFRLIFKNTFKWELRWNSKPSQNTKRKQSINNWNKWKVSEAIKKINQERAELEKNEVEFLFEQVKWKVDNLLLEDLENKNTLNKKIIYILFSLGLLEEENDEKLADFIKTFQDRDIWFLQTAKSIKWLIIKIKPELEKEIDEENLKKRLRERYNKYYKK